MRWMRITGNVSGAPICVEKWKPKWAVYASNLNLFCWILRGGMAAHQSVFLFTLLFTLKLVRHKSQLVQGYNLCPYSIR